MDLESIWKKIKNFFTEEQRQSPAPNPSVKKKFVVTRRKTFTVKKRAPMNVLKETRPDNCPLCKSRTTIVLLSGSDNHWICSPEKKGCGFEW